MGILNRQHLALNASRKHLLISTGSLCTEESLGGGKRKNSYFSNLFILTLFPGGTDT